MVVALESQVVLLSLHLREDIRRRITSAEKARVICSERQTKVKANHFHFVAQHIYDVLRRRRRETRLKILDALLSSENRFGRTGVARARSYPGRRSSFPQQNK